jgi:hypothetical protein
MVLNNGSESISYERFNKESRMKGRMAAMICHMTASTVYRFLLLKF